MTAVDNIASADVVTTQDLHKLAMALERPLDAIGSHVIGNMLHTSTAGRDLPSIAFMVARFRQLGLGLRSILSPDGAPTVRGARSGLPSFALGSSLDFHEPVTVGEPVRTTVQVMSERDVVGRTGRMRLEKLKYELLRHESESPAVTEIFTKGHRSGAVAARQPPRNQNDSTHWHAMGEPFTIDVVDCFLYCAAVWLPHRIHYDEPYARSEGHPGVLVPGPFQGSILAAAFAEIVGTDIFGWRLSYRHVGSMVAGQPSQLLTREVASPSRPTELHALLVGPDGAHQTTGVLTKLEPS